MDSCIDHIVIGAANLISGTNILETKLCTKFSPGGEHKIMGTHNKLLKLQSDIYLEIIANNPDADKPSRQRWFSLDESSIKEDVSKFYSLIKGNSPIANIIKKRLKQQVKYFLVGTRATNPSV